MMSPAISMVLATICYLVLLWTFIDRTFISRRSTYFLTATCFAIIILLLVTGAIWVFLAFYLLFFFELILMQRHLANWLLPALILLFQYALIIFVRLITFFIPQFLVTSVSFVLLKNQLMLGVIQICFLSVLSYLLKKLDRKYQFIRSLKEMPQAFFLSGISFFVVFITLMTILNVISLFGPFTLIFLILLLFFSITTQVISVRILRNKIYQKNAYLEALKLSMKEEKENYELAREYRHDFRSLMLGLNEYLASEDLEGAKDFLLQTLKDSEDYFKEYRYNQLAEIQNAAIRGVLTDFIHRCERHHIYLELKINNQDVGLPISQIDLVRSISIVLNNAFEATINEPKKYIYIELRNTLTHWQMTVTNPSTIDSPSIATLVQKNFSTKDNHSGLGLYQLQKISHKYADFSLVIDKSPEQFNVDITISQI